MMQHKEILVSNSINKAKEALYDAELAINNDRYTNASNRIYYAVFYSVLALGYLENFTTSKHSQLMGWFNKKFIYEDKIFDKELFITYQTAFESRRKSDYEITYKPTKEKVIKAFEDANVFVNAIEGYLKDKI